MVDNSASLTESRSQTTPRSAEDRWTMRLVAATITMVSVILVVAALSTLQSIRKAEPPASRKTDPQLSPVKPISQACACNRPAGPSQTVSAIFSDPGIHATAVNRSLASWWRS